MFVTDPYSNSKSYSVLTVVSSKVREEENNWAPAPALGLQLHLYYNCFRLDLAIYNADEEITSNEDMFTTTSYRYGYIYDNQNIYPA